MLTFVLAALLTLFFYIYLRRKQYPENFPPGPRHFLPFLGDPLFAIGFSGGLEKMEELHQKFGPLVGFNFCGFKIVSISNLEILKKILALEEFSRRPHQEAMITLRGGLLKDGSCPGILSSNGENWKNMRRFTLRCLRDFGFGKKSMEDLIEEELDHFLTSLDQTKGEIVNTTDIFNIPLLNALWRILTGERMDPNIQKTSETLARIESVITNLGNPLAFISMTSPRALEFFEITGALKVSDSMNFILEVIDEIITSHEKTFQRENLRDFIDCFLAEKMCKHSEINSFEDGDDYGDDDGVEDDDCDARKNLKNIILDLLFGGSETTSSTLRWAVLYMALNPHLQTQVQDELDRNIEAKNVNCNGYTKISTPYTDAVLLEVQRLGNVFPISILHTSANSTKVGDFYLPKDTTVLPFLTSILKDPVTFPNPDQFKPERYLDDQGHFVPHPNVVPYGIGRRRCLGESLAKIELRIFFAGLMKRFNIQLPDGAARPTTQYRQGLTLSPMPFQIRFVPRK